jgi:hypothetical protein
MSDEYYTVTSSVAGLAPIALEPRDLSVLLLGLECMWRDSDDWAEYGEDVVRLMGLLQTLLPD